jgi:putative pyruvate formate lyase activating enzyme
MRSAGEQGACGLSDGTHVYNHFLHFGEESALVPSYTIYLSGCSMSCSFCSEADHLVPPFTRGAADPVELARRVAPRLGGAKNINFVGGEPTVQLPFVARFARAIRALGDDTPLLCNTNGYLTPEALEASIPLFSIWVVDLKFGNDRCAQSVSNTDAYLEVLHRNLLLLGAAEVDLWVRHLLMPGHLECCTSEVLRWLEENLPDAKVNMMPAFYPFRHARNDKWPALAGSERDRGHALLRAAGLRRRFFDGRRLAL